MPSAQVPLTSADEPGDRPPAVARVGFLGVGVMGEAVLAGVLRGTTPPGRVVVTARRSERGAQLGERHGVRVLPAREVAGADVVVLGVKPQQLDALMAEVASAVSPDALVVSLIAGVPTARLEGALAPGTAVVRTMPNTPALVGAGTTVIAAGTHATPDHLTLVEELFAGTGDVVRVSESLVDAATGLSGSGPAYVFAIADALAEGGVHAGLPRDLAHRLAAGTLLGAARLITETGQHPALLREQVTSPAGTTAAGLRELDERGLRAALIAAVLAAARRAGELADPRGAHR